MGKHGERFLMILEIDGLFSADEGSEVAAFEAGLAEA